MTSSLRETSTFAFSILALLCLGFGIRTAIHSPLFMLQVVEVNDQAQTQNAGEESPVDPQTIMDLAAVPVGKVNLFALDLDAVEKRILTQPWIREVKLQKRFPQTLSISVTYRKPRALVQSRQGSLAYVDDEGRIFGKVNLKTPSDLPIVSGLNGPADSRAREALRLISEWEKQVPEKQAQLASLDWDGERGFRALATYPMASNQRGRVMIDFGQEIDGELDLQFQRLSSVLGYLGDKSIAATQIWADAGKKIVVRTAHGS